MIIAIDGPAASGKGTIGRKLAEHYGYRYLDTGLLYRAVAKNLLDKKLSLESEREATRIANALRLEDLALGADRLISYGTAAAAVAAFPEVRRALLRIQRDFASKPPGVVLDGRDIGTVIVPGADVKIFVTATAKVRAKRRALELHKRGQSVKEEDVLADIVRRDERDTEREAAPLRPAADAHLLDTTHLNIEAAFEAAVAIVEAAKQGRKCG
jgi:CMP/dCMP kinase